MKSPFPQVLYSGQDVIEKALGEQATAKGAPIERGRKVTSIDQDADGVTVIVATVDDEGKETGASETLRCRYVVGADGDKGFVRKSLGLDFSVDKLTGRATWQIDAKLTWQRSTQADQLWFFVYHHGFAGVLPVWEGYHRMFFLEDEERMPDREPTLEEMQAHAREVTGDGTLTFTDPDLAFAQQVPARPCRALCQGARIPCGGRRPLHAADRRTGHERRHARCGVHRLAVGHDAGWACRAGGARLLWHRAGRSSMPRSTTTRPRASAASSTAAASVMPRST